MNATTAPLALFIAEGCEPPSHWASLGLTRVSRRPRSGFFLELRAGTLALQHAAAHARDRGLSIDLLDAGTRRRLAGARRSPLARALSLRRHPGATVLDATCGLGRDSVTMTALGARVHALERHPGLFALLDNARRRARAANNMPAWLDNWRTLACADARHWLTRPDRPAVDVVYIDPMFTAARRKAQPQKALAWLHELLGPDDDADELLAVARRRATRQTVVKQHARSQPLAPPDRQVHGKAVRFDVYLTTIKQA